MKLKNDKKLNKQKKNNAASLHSKDNNKTQIEV